MNSVGVCAHIEGQRAYRSDKQVLLGCRRGFVLTAPGQQARWRSFSGPRNAEIRLASDAALEGMALRRAVVVPDVHGCAEAVGDERCGFIYRHEDLDDLAEQTLAALADRQRGRRARERVQAEYDWRVVAPKLDALYRGEAAAKDKGIA